MCTAIIGTGLPGARNITLPITLFLPSLVTPHHYHFRGACQDVLQMSTSVGLVLGRSVILEAHNRGDIAPSPHLSYNLHLTASIIESTSVHVIRLE